MLGPNIPGEKFLRPNVCLAKKHKTDFTTGRNRAVFWQTEKGKKSGVNSKNMEAAQRYAERANKRNISVIKTENNQTENQIREYAMKRGIRLTNWSITQKHMIKSQLPMLSQIHLTSMNDRI